LGLNAFVGVQESVSENYIGPLMTIRSALGRQSCARSPSILPPSNDWPPRVHVTGYYFVPPNNSYQPSAELLSFLQEGEPPVCITFGSMVNRDKDRIDRTVREALKQTGYRGIILSGWSGVEKAASNDLLYLEAAPHDWLLPHCKMVIHHGSAGQPPGLRGIQIFDPYWETSRFGVKESVRLAQDQSLFL
jgi:hypothetical protein